MNEFNPDLLAELHLLTRDGKPTQDTRRKLKQVEHLIAQLEPILLSVNAPHLVDVGSGKSYLGFLLADRWRRLGRALRVTSIEARSDLVRTAKDAAARFSLQESMEFIESKAAELDHSQLKSEGAPTLVSALHACDVATDEAIRLGLALNAQAIGVVPCCQAEVARILTAQPRSEVSLLWKHGNHARVFGAALTNAIRTAFLEARGYRVRVIEFTGWEHTAKSELILAQKTDVSEARESELESQLDSLVSRFGLQSMALLKA